MDKEKHLKKCRKCISCQFMFDCPGVENPDMCIRYYERKVEKTEATTKAGE